MVFHKFSLNHFGSKIDAIIVSLLTIPVFTSDNPLIYFVRFHLAFKYPLQMHISVTIFSLDFLSACTKGALVFRISRFKPPDDQSINLSVYKRQTCDSRKPCLMIVGIYQCAPVEFVNSRPPFYSRPGNCLPLFGHIRSALVSRDQSSDA